MDKYSINPAHDIPEGFYKILEPYFKGKRFENRNELVCIWEAALQYRQNFPEHDDAIAESVFSLETFSGFVDDNDLYEAIHAMLGSLEVRGPKETDADRQQEWRKIGELVAEARQKLSS